MRRVLSPDDLKKSDLIDPVGWHPVELVDYDEKDASTDGSTNCIFHFKVIGGPAEGRGGTKLINEKSLEHRTNQPLWNALGIAKTPEGGLDLSSELFRSKINSKLKAYVKRGKTNNNNEFNDFADFQPLS